MTAAVRRPSDLGMFASEPCRDTCSAAPRKSSGPFLRLATLDGRRIDPHVLRREFPDRWAAFLHATMRDATEVAFFYGVTDRAARDWWNGITAARGSSVVLASRAFPEVFDQMFPVAA